MKTRFLVLWAFAIILFAVPFTNTALWGQATPTTAEEFRSRGWTFVERRDWDRAITDFNEAIRLDPNFARAYRNRSVAYFRKGDHNRALADANQSIRIDPNNYNSYSNRGWLYLEMGDNDRAIADYSEAIRLDDPNADSYNNRGLAYERKGDFDRAITDYNEAIRLDPNADRYYNRGLTYFNKGDFDRAITDYSDAIRLAPNADRYNNRGAAYFNKGDFDRAITDYEAALRINPNYQLAKDNLAAARNRRPALSIPFPSASTTLDDAIRRFPAPLQSGFREIYTAILASGQTQTDALTAISAYWLCNWTKVNYILAGKGNEIIQSGRTVTAYYNGLRGGLIQGLPSVIMLAAISGRLPGGNETWDDWGLRVIEWL